LFVAFLSGGALAGNIVPLVIGAIVYVAIAGFFVSAACGYMAGLIGSSNSPVSGLAILTVLGASLLLAALAKSSNPGVAATLVAYALFVTAVVLCVATIANDNLQDLKTGQLVDATPWKQQVALIVGVVFGAIVIPPILDLLNHAYGFAGAPPQPGGTTPGQPLPAPQAALISTLAKGVISGDIPWNLIGIGVLAGFGIIALDEILRATRKGALPPLAVGIGIYLPVGTIRRPARLGTHRRGEPLRRRAGGHYRGQRQRHAARDRRRFVRSRRDRDRRPRVRRHGRRPLCLDRASRPEGSLAPPAFWVTTVTGARQRARRRRSGSHSPEAARSSHQSAVKE
jgi:putative OPT family oligopeptide transporter